MAVLVGDVPVVRFEHGDDGLEIAADRCAHILIVNDVVSEREAPPPTRVLVAARVIDPEIAGVIAVAVLFPRVRVVVVAIPGGLVRAEVPRDVALRAGDFHDLVQVVRDAQNLGAGGRIARGLEAQGLRAEVHAGPDGAVAGIEEASERGAGVVGELGLRDAAQAGGVPLLEECLVGVRLGLKCGVDFSGNRRERNEKYQQQSKKKNRD